MGRIDDALRRAQGGAGASSLTVPDQQVFAAPWDVADPVLAVERQPATAGARSGTLLDESGRSSFGGFSPEWAHRLVIAPDADHGLVEQFRSLAATLHRIQADGVPKVLMVTSADPGEGKTLTALNLALTLSESYRQRVLLVDADLRRPSIREISQLGDITGLTEGLKAPADKKLSVIGLTRTLALLPAGSPDPNPMSSLTSPRMRRIVAEAAERFDWVILDSPPLGPVADAGLLASMVDGALLVVRAARTSYGAVAHAIEALGRERILGVVLNGVEESEVAPYGRYYGGDAAGDAAIARLRE